MRFVSDEQRKAIIAKIRAGDRSQSYLAPRVSVGKANPKGKKQIPVKTPEYWVASAAYNCKLARIAARDKQYRHGWENAWKSAEKCIKAGGPTFQRKHHLVQPLAKLRSRYPEITDQMMDTARWMEDKGWDNAIAYSALTEGQILCIDDDYREQLLKAL